MKFIPTIGNKERKERKEGDTGSNSSLELHQLNDGRLVGFLSIPSVTESKGSLSASKFWETPIVSTPGKVIIHRYFLPKKELDERKGLFHTVKAARSMVESIEDETKKTEALVELSMGMVISSMQGQPWISVQVDQLEGLLPKFRSSLSKQLHQHGNVSAYFDSIVRELENNQTSGYFEDADHLLFFRKITSFGDQHINNESMAAGPSTLEGLQIVILGPNTENASVEQHSDPVSDGVLASSFEGTTLENQKNTMLDTVPFDPVPDVVSTSENTQQVPLPYKDEESVGVQPLQDQSMVALRSQFINSGANFPVISVSNAQPIQQSTEFVPNTSQNEINTLSPDINQSVDFASPQSNVSSLFEIDPRGLTQQELVFNSQDNQADQKPDVPEVPTNVFQFPAQYDVPSNVTQFPSQESTMVLGNTKVIMFKQTH